MTEASDGVAVVTGGSRGLGAVLVERLLDQGWRVATFSRHSNSLIEKLRAATPDRYWWGRADLTDLHTLQRFIGAVLRRFGHIDALINNAGVLEHQELLVTVAPDRIQPLITANLVAPIVLAQACSRSMIRRGGGVVINISSVNAIRGYRGVAVYSAAKAGLDGFSRSLARELGPLNIRVNSVVPGFFESAMTNGVTDENRDRILRRTPLRRLAAATEVANIALYLCSAEASFITGQTIVVDGGITC